MILILYTKYINLLWIFVYTNISVFEFNSNKDHWIGNWKVNPIAVLPEGKEHGNLVILYSMELFQYQVFP